MGTARKLFLPLILILLLCCGACAPGTPEPSPPAPPAETAGEPVDGAAVIETSPPVPAGQTAEPGSAPDAASPSPEVTDPAETQPTETPSAPPSETQPPQTPSPSASPAPAPPPSPPKPADGPVVLTISGSGVTKETVWTLSQLQALREGYREYTYSTTNNWPSYGRMTAHGVSLPYLLRQAGVLDNAASFKFISADGYYVTVTRNQVFGKLNSYANHGAGGSSGASSVESAVAWEWGDGAKSRPENIRPFFGQAGPMDVNTSAFVKDLCRIEVSTASPGAWAAPGASVPDGGVVPAGTEFQLQYGDMDSVRIYYTLDGSEPDYGSAVYNPSTSYFQPQLIKPLILTQSVTVKAFAAALGKERSPVATFNITVE